MVAECARQSDWDGIVACHRGYLVVTTWNHQKGSMGAHKLEPDRFNHNRALNVHATVSMLSLAIRVEQYGPKKSLDAYNHFVSCILYFILLLRIFPVIISLAHQTLFHHFSLCKACGIPHLVYLSFLISRDFLWALKILGMPEPPVLRLPSLEIQDCILTKSDIEAKSS